MGHIFIADIGTRHALRMLCAPKYFKHVHVKIVLGISHPAPNYTWFTEQGQPFMLSSAVRHKLCAIDKGL